MNECFIKQKMIQQYQEATIEIHEREIETAHPRIEIWSSFFDI